MRPPGTRLRAITSRLCGARTLERVIDPLIADLQIEYAEAVRDGSAWRGHWIRLAGGVTLLKVLVLCGGRSLLSLEAAAVGEPRAMSRAIACSAAAMGGVVVLLEAPFWRTLHMAVQANQPGMFLYLIPQALPIAIPIGLTIGILFGFRGRVLSTRTTSSLMTIAVAWSAISFAILVWLMPAANQSYRESAADIAGIHPRGALAKGLNEMSLTELSGQIQSYRHTAMADSQRVRNLTFSYHQRWSLACATGVLALFAIGVLARPTSGRWTLGLAVISVCFAYYALIFLGRLAALSGAVPAFAGAWLPNIVLLLFAWLLRIAPAPQPATS